MQRYKTGEQCTKTGKYSFDGYLDGSLYPQPTTNEKIIPLSVGETFPPVRSANKGAWWKFIG
ncbi:MAG: YjzC family protein [Opitutaceae bacterium]|nr:YjzC family protein [Opitutaceae bacterium]